MKLTGTGIVRGATARGLADYTYRKPVLACVDAWQIDPERLSLMHEYPRSVNKPSQTNTQTVELVDYCVTVILDLNSETLNVRTWVTPNENTLAKTPLEIDRRKVTCTTWAQIRDRVAFLNAIVDKAFAA
jgi:hypothetical protein